MNVYLQALPDPINLPIKCKLIVEQNKKHILNISFKRTDKVKLLFDKIEKFYQELGDPITSWCDSCFEIRKLVFVPDINGELKEEIEVVKLLDTDELFLSVPIISGDEIWLTGAFSTNSKRVKECITYGWKEGLITTYLSCSDCKLNWICKECSITCHQNHNLKMFKENHTTTWSCCYCLRGNCKLKNKSNLTN